MRLANGVLIGRYRVEGPIGAGGMGEVYRVTDTRSGETLALKTLPAGSLAPKTWERFLNEATIQSQIAHPAIAAFHEMFLWGEHPCLVMEYVEGETLDQRLARAGPLLPQDAVNTLTPLCAALSYLHSLGILHRDLKSSNVKLTPEGGVKLIDFGIARFRGANRLTQVGAVAGTPEMLAPELLRGRPAEEASEIWSLGALAYEMLTGRLPFAGVSDTDLYRQILESNPPPPSDMNLAVPGALDRVVMRCLHKDPARRYRSCSQLQAALASIVWESSDRRLRKHLKPRVWKRAAMAAGALLALWLGALAIGGLQRQGGEMQTITIDAVGGAAEVYEGGRLVGHTPYAFRARSGESIDLELRREGSAPQPVQFEVSQRKAYSYSLNPMATTAPGR